MAALSVAADCRPGKPVWNPQAVSRLTFGLGGYEARGRSLERNQRFARHGPTAARGEHAHLPQTGLRPDALASAAASVTFPRKGVCA